MARRLSIHWMFAIDSRRTVCGVPITETVETTRKMEDCTCANCNLYIATVCEPGLSPSAPTH